MPAEGVPPRQNAPAPFVLVESCQEVYRVARHSGTRDTTEGVRSVVLDGAALRLELKSVAESPELVGF
ncbi:hypothetical protein ETD86_04975 [Nonomuraea turkmeniaca]|uniref:Uncharacterized protein n=1 Tax=Nonomuraea turkmeniaca TaxID=103838 RepID=A0A5S4FU30_9ACTN|nr:hypothetical protein [Nonomuraea turkmeniaca]TMR24266.1 hypothetical protein ETD86_04975 [Nonomuraea turkmeniaca]